MSDDDSDDDEEDIPYNPKNLPLGWDGKPIPYWLYKLHGLNISYNCEICGNHVYRGPKAFQRHFAVSILSLINMIFCIDLLSPQDPSPLLYGID